MLHPSVTLAALDGKTKFGNSDTRPVGGGEYYDFSREKDIVIPYYVAPGSVNLAQKMLPKSAAEFILSKTTFVLC